MASKKLTSEEWALMAAKGAGSDLFKVAPIKPVPKMYTKEGNWEGVSEKIAMEKIVIDKKVDLPYTIVAEESESDVNPELVDSIAKNIIDTVGELGGNISIGPIVVSEVEGDGTIHFVMEHSEFIDPHKEFNHHGKTYMVTEVQYEALGPDQDIIQKVTAKEIGPQVNVGAKHAQKLEYGKPPENWPHSTLTEEGKKKKKGLWAKAKETIMGVDLAGKPDNVVFTHTPEGKLKSEFPLYYNLNIAYEVWDDELDKSKIPHKKYYAKGTIHEFEGKMFKLETIEKDSLNQSYKLTFKEKPTSTVTTDDEAGVFFHSDGTVSKNSEKQQPATDKWWSQQEKGSTNGVADSSIPKEVETFTPRTEREKMFRELTEGVSG